MTVLHPLFRCLACWFVWAGIGFAHVPPAVAQAVEQIEEGKPWVLLISLDGFKPAYLNEHDAPNLMKLARQGVLAQGLISSFPSLTFPNHLTLVTGQTPDHHGIVNNNMSDPLTKQAFSLGSREAVENPFWWQDSQPIWVHLNKQGKRASTLFWPGSEAPIQGLHPDDWLRYEHSMPHEKRISILLEWLMRPVSQRPDLATLYFSDVDSAGHRAGPNSVEVVAAVRKVDATIGLLLQQLGKQRLLKQATVLVVSDHGMAESPPEKVIAVHERLRQYPAARWEWQGATAAVRLHGEPLEGVMNALSDLPHAQCWPKANIPARFRFGQHRRVPEIVCLADLGYALSDDPSRPGPLGQHGYDPELDEMYGILIAAGPRIRPAQIGLVSNLDLYHLLCDLLLIEPAPNDGRRDLSRLLLSAP